jgi:hypothetical protein
MIGSLPAILAPFVIVRAEPKESPREALAASTECLDEEPASPGNSSPAGSE